MKTSVFSIAVATCVLAGAATAAPIGPTAFGPNAQAESFENFVPAGQGVAFLAQPATFASRVTTMNRGASSPGVLELSTSGASGCFGVAFQTNELVDGTAVICANPFVSQSGEEQGFEFILPVNAVRAGIYLASTSKSATLVVEARDTNGQVVERVTKSDPAGIANFADNFLGIDAGAPIIKSIFVALDVSTGVLMDRLVFEGATDTPPIADAGDDQSVRMLGGTVMLDGSGSFDDNTASGDLQYAWQLTGKPAGSNAALAGASTATPTFVADVSGSFTVSLVVTDSLNQMSEADEVVVSSANLAPTADAGPDQIVSAGAMVDLDGSASSDPENDFLSYSWILTGKPPGSNATLFDASLANPYFQADVEGTYTAALTVSDQLGSSAPDEVEITAIDAKDFALGQILKASAAIAALKQQHLASPGLKVALLSQLAVAARNVQANRRHSLVALTLLKANLSRVDGCTLRGTPDGGFGLDRDWVTDCNAQRQIYQHMKKAIAALG